MHCRFKFLCASLFFIFFQLSQSQFLKGACPDIESDEFCGKHGKCQKAPHQNNEPAHWCRCDQGYGGIECEKKCDIQCGVGSKCVFDFAQRSTCVCEDCDQFNQTITKCSTGYGGKNCAKRGFCYPDSCLNGGKCVGDGDAARCACPSGLTGRFCEIDIDECVERPCLNGKCVNLFGSFECNCDAGFIPPRCFVKGGLMDYPPKQPNVCMIHVTENNREGKNGYCQNGGICKRLEGNRTVCDCPPGFDGELCEKDLNECLFNPCLNGATCRNYDGGFQCFCMAGFKGQFCEINEDDCIGNKCALGSKCIDEIASYHCQCQNGTIGEFCDIIDPCVADPKICNHGQCTSIPDTGDFYCDCDHGFEGTFCDKDIDECKHFQTNLCSHGGLCVNMPGTWKCECLRGYNGTQCETVMDTCESENVECQNGGVCFTGPRQEPICQCRQGFIGRRCETACPTGFGGVRCDLNLSIPACGRGIGRCFNDGKCLNGTCQCPVNFTGNHCETNREEARAYAVEKSCKEDPCLNNATCIDVVDRIGHVCLCREGFEGDVCERRKNFCQINPCFNGGKCVGNWTGYRCECPKGWNGNNCEKTIEFKCSENACVNGGSCSITVDNRAKCECLYGFAGPRCEQKIEVESYVSRDRIIRDMCNRNNCTERANDGNCDLECNFAACDFDGGDCSGRQRPFAKCRYGNMCADLFANGICDQACNNEDCLFDGMDCLPKVPRCPRLIRERCAARFADGVCDAECNLEGCGFDGGDCDKKANNKTILSDIRVKILMSPTKFASIGGEILMDISSSLRSIIRIQRDQIGPLVFEWNGDDDEENESQRLKMNVKQLEESKMLVERRIRKRRATKENKGVMVWLEVEVGDQAEKSCAVDKMSCLFSSSQSVVDFLSAEIAKKDKSQLGVPIYEAMVAKPTRRGSTWSLSQMLLLAIIAFVVLGTAVAGVITLNGDERRSRKRKIISAPVWIPPTENEVEKTRKSHALSASSQNSLLGGGGHDFYEVKRKKTDVGYNMMSGIGGDCHIYQANTSIGHVAQFSADFGGYGDSHLQLQQNGHISQQTWCSLHLEAAGNGLISVDLNEENVNQEDSKNRRTVLHWLAANAAGKHEEVIVEETKKCIEAGANVNARDIDDNTPLLLAVKARRLRLANVIMIAGGDPTIFNKSERSALHEAAVNLDLKMIKLLLRDKRMLKEIDELDRNGRTALMEVAGLDQDTEIAEYLIKSGAKVDADGASRKDSEVYKGRTALHYAAHYGNLQMVKFLIASNANKDKQDENGQTPIMLAAKEGRRSTVLYFIEKGASLDTVDLMEQSARQLALNQQHKDVVALIDRAAHDREMAESAIRQQMHMINGKNGKTGRPSVKAVKKSASRKEYSACSSSSRDSTIHMTPPPSDGSMSSPSPQHYVHPSRMTPTSLHCTATTSPLSQAGQQQQMSGGCGLSLYNPHSNSSSRSGVGSGASSGIGSDSSPEYHPQELDMTSYNSNMWYTSNVPYQTMPQHPGYAGMYEHKPLNQAYY